MSARLKITSLTQFVDKMQQGSWALVLSSFHFGLIDLLGTQIVCKRHSVDLFVTDLTIWDSWEKRRRWFGSRIRSIMQCITQDETKELRRAVFYQFMSL